MRSGLLLLLLVSTAEAKTSFRFQVPPGWTNLSPDAPPSELQKAPPALVEQARAGHFAFFAANLGSGGYMQSVNAIVERGSAAITQPFLDQVTRAISDEAARSGTKYRIVQMGLSKIGAVTVGRYVGELDLGGFRVKQIGYLVPGKGEHAILTYSTTPAAFAHDQPIFDEAARATLGVEEPSMLEDTNSPFRWESLVATLAALGLVVGYSLWAQKKKREAG